MTARRAYGSGSVYPVTDKNGRERWIGTFTVDGRRKYVSGKTRTEASRKLEDAKRGPVKPRQRGERLSDFLARWLRMLRVSERTRDGYRHIVEDRIVPTLGHIRLDHLRADDIIAWQAEQSERHSPQTVAHSLAVLRAALNQAVAWDHIPSSPARKGLVPSVKVPRREYRMLTDQESRAFLSSVGGDPLEALWILAVELGMRSGELRGLRWRDLDLDAGTLTVANVITTAGGKLVHGPPKTEQSRRVLPLPPKAAALLRARREATTVLRFDGLVWQDVSGRPITDQWLVRRFQQRLAEAGLPRVRLHDCRHALATRLIRSGASLAYVQRILGHSTISTTVMVYGHLGETEVRDALEAVRLA